MLQPLVLTPEIMIKCDVIVTLIVTETMVLFIARTMIQITDHPFDHGDVTPISQCDSLSHGLYCVVLVGVNSRLIYLG